jgi:hypothetical protein
MKLRRFYQFLQKIQFAPLNCCMGVSNLLDKITIKVENVYETDPFTPIGFRRKV